MKRSERVVNQLGAQEMADVVAEMETDDAVDIVEELGEKERRDVLDALPIGERTLIEGLYRGQCRASYAAQCHGAARALERGSGNRFYARRGPSSRFL